MQERGVFYIIRAAAVLSALLGMAVCNCSKGTDPPSDPWAEDRAAFSAALGAQARYSDLWDSLIVSLDSATVQDSVITIMLQDSTIDTAWTTFQGMWIQYRWGMKSCIITDPEASIPSSYYETHPYEQGIFAAQDVLCPLGKSCVYFATAFAEMRGGDQQVIDAVSLDLAGVGYNPLQAWKDEECTVDRMANPAGCGIVHISGHSSIFDQDPRNPEHVYLKTGETPVEDSETWIKYITDLRDERSLIPAIVKGSSPERYSKYYFNTKFAAKHWRAYFAQTRPVVYLSSCSSALAGWLETLKSIGALAGIGYDRTVLVPWSWEKADEFYGTMCDITEPTPVRLSGWHASIDRCKFDLRYGNTCLVYSAMDNTDPALWNGYLRVVATDPVDGASEVLPFQAMIRATFILELAPATVNATTFRITPSIPGEIVVDGIRAVFIPATELAENTLYTVTLETGIADQYGHTLKEAYSWSFRTTTWEEAVGELNDRIAATWRRDDGQTEPRFPYEMTLTKTSFGGGYFSSNEGDANYAISDEFDLMLIDGDGNLIITYGVEVAGDSLWLSNWTSRVLYLRSD